MSENSAVCTYDKFNKYTKSMYLNNFNFSLSQKKHNILNHFISELCQNWKETAELLKKKLLKINRK